MTSPFAPPDPADPQAPVQQVGPPVQPGQQPLLRYGPGPSAQAPMDAALPRTYPQLLRGPRYRWWKSLLSIVMALGGFLILQIVLGVAVLALLMANAANLDDLMDQESLMTSLMSGPSMPWFFLANNLGLAALIPVAGLSVWACHGWRPRWVSSVMPKLRWRLMAIAAAVSIAVYAIYALVSVLVTGESLPTGGRDVALLLVIVVLTTPLQAAGEEYLFRGVLTQSIGSWFAKPLAAFAVSALVTALAFAAVHSLGGPQNFWLFFTRFGIGLAMSYLTWRTGGLEAGIALHTVNNVFGLVPAILAGGLGEALSNPPQQTWPSLLQLLSVAVIAALIVVVAARLAARNTHDPARQPGGAPAATDCWPTLPSTPGGDLTR